MFNKNCLIVLIWCFLFVFSCESGNKKLDEDQEKDFNELPELVWDSDFPGYLHNKALYDGHNLYVFHYSSININEMTKKLLTVYAYDDKTGITLWEVCEFVVEIASVDLGIKNYERIYDFYIRFTPSRIRVNYDFVEGFKNGLLIKNEFKVLLAPVECVWPNVYIENDVWENKFYTLGRFNSNSDLYDEALSQLKCKWTFYGPAYSFNDLKSIVSEYVEELDDIDGYCNFITQGFFNKEYEGIEFLGKDFLKEMKINNEDKKVIFDPYWDNKNADGYKYEFEKKVAFYLDEKAGEYDIFIDKEKLHFSNGLQSYLYNIYIENSKLVAVSRSIYFDLIFR